MSSLLLTTKLHVPQVRLEHVLRPRLVQCLQHGLAYKLILISAPAGYGKTTSVCEWLGDCGQPSAWVSLDKEDNDPARFWSYVLVALQGTLSSAGKTLPEILLHDNLPVSETLITNLINELDKLQQPLILVLDDYHNIETPVIHDGLSFLLEHAPSNFHLVIATRADPPLPLARLRAHSQMAELRLADLRFTIEETTEFLRKVMSLDLSETDLSLLETSTEGWIAGLQMAGLSLQGKKDASTFIRSFSGENRYVLDFLFEEVFRRQPREIQDFLLRTSVLDQLCESLCNALTLRDDGQTMLGILERSNLFLISLDDRRKWYRYHHLFSDLLQSRLKQTFPDEMTGLHRRASVWYATQNNLESAIDHALDSGDYLLVNELVSGNVLAIMEHAELIGVLRHFERIPASEMETKPWLAVAYAWTKAYVDPSEELDGKIAQIESGLAGVEDNAEKRHLTSHLDAIRAYVAWVKGRAEQALSYASKSLENLPDDDWMARCHILNIEGLAHQYLQDLNQAVQSFEDAILAGQRTPSSYETFHAYTNLAFAKNIQGQLHQAFSLCQNVLNLAEQSGEITTRMPVLAYAFATLSQVQLEWNNVQSALSNARKAVTRAEEWNQADTLHFALTCLAEALCAAGDLEEALQVNQRAMQLAKSVSLWFFRISACAEARLHLANGDVRAASRILEEIEPLIEARDKVGNFLIAKTALLLAQERFADVVLTLESPVCEMERRGRDWPLLELLPCMALALHGIGRKEEAQGMIGRCLALAAPEGFVYTFVKRGEPMRKLLLEALKQSIEVDYTQQLLSAFHPRVGRPMPETGIVPATATRFSTSVLVEPLSGREIEVLKLLGHGFSDKQIAATLVVSRETVHKHLKNIYGKLGVHSRTEAIAHARELGLL